jgi:UDP-GlcNAc:undecaprenyl-phosphate GlcNAc-1-phosphate transferase
VLGPILFLLAASFALSLGLTLAMTRLSPRIGFVDRPGHRKIHHNPKPLGGGVAMFWAIAVVMLGGLAGVWVVPEAMLLRVASGEDVAALLGGAARQAPLALGLLGAALALHVLGLIDDARALGPYGKLAVQLGVTAGFVAIFDVRAVTFLDNLGLGRWPSVLVTVLWIGTITNAFNFLDNMDGLSAGVAAVCTTAFLVTALLIGQWFVAATLAVLMGAVLGFLAWNFPPAKIFMGDSGSLVIGFILGVLTVRTTFVPPGTDLAAGWYAIFAPLIVLAVPLYDFLVVTVIRLARGHSPFRGDTNHFSHRLVARGMSRRTAVLCIYLVTASTSASAIVLTQVRGTLAAVLIFGQTVLVLGLVALLEQHPLPSAWRDDENGGPRT